MLSKTKEINKIVIPTPFLVGPVNVYLVKGDALTLVDNGPRTLAAKNVLLESLEQLGYRTNDIEQVILTHHHPDHVGLTEDLFPNAKIIGHHKNEAWLTKKADFILFVEKFLSGFFKEHGVTEELIEKMIKSNRYFLSFTGERGLDVEIEEGDKLDGLPGWSVIETPGHAQSHISLYDEKKGLLLGGDHIISHISSNAILEPPYNQEELRPHTLLQYRDSLQKCLRLDVSKVYSGHGEEVEDLKGLLESRFKEHDQKAVRLKRMIPSEGISSFELCKQYFPRVFMHEPTLTMSEIIGHLDLLVAREEIETTNRDGLIFYKLK